MAVDIEKYRKAQPQAGAAPVDVNKYRKAPSNASTFNVPMRPTAKLEAAQADQAQYDAEANKGFLGRFGKALVKNIAPSEVGLGKTISSLLFQGSKVEKGLQQSILSGQDTQTDLIKQIRENEAKGIDTTKLKQLYNEGETQLKKTTGTANSLVQLPSNLQAVGQIGGTALDLLTAGTYSKAKTGAMATGSLFRGSTPAVKTLATAAGAPELGVLAGQKAGGLFSLRGAGNIATGAATGYATDVTAGLQGLRGEKRTGTKAFIPGLGTALGTAIPVVSEAGQTVKNIRNPEPRIMNKRAQTLDTLAKKYTKVDKAVKAGERNGVDVKRILAETNLLNGAVDDDGLLAADRALANFDEFISPFEGKVREAIQSEGRKVNIQNIATEADDFVRNSRLPGAAKDQLRAALESDMRGFAINGRQVPVEALHDTKIFRNSHANYMDTGANEVSKEAARFFKEQVEKNVGSLDVKNYNNELSKYYAVKDVIESLNKTRVQGGRLGKYFSSVIGTGIGGMAGGPLGGIIGAEAGARIQGQMMSRALGGDISAGLTPSSALINASRNVTGKAAVPSLVLPRKATAIGDVVVGQSSKVGSRQMSQATTIPITNAVPKKAIPASVTGGAKAVNSGKLGKLTPKQVNNKKIFEQFGDIGGTPDNTRKLSDNLKVTDAYGKTNFGFNIVGMEKKANETGYPLYEKLLKYVDSESTTEGRIAGFNKIINEMSNFVKKESVINPKTKAKIATFERATGLTKTGAAIEDKAFKKIEKEEEQLVTQYLSDKKLSGEDGKVVNTDNFRPLFKDIGYKGSNAADVQEPSSYLSKKAFTKLLSQNPEKYVTFLAGGSGSGKTSAVKNLKRLSKTNQNSAAILDSNLSSYSSAKKRIDEATKFGKKVRIEYVYRDPVESFEQGVVTRMLNNSDEMGRLVPGKVVAGNHIDSFNVVRRLQDEGYRVVFIDNSLGQGKAKIVKREDLEKKVNLPSQEELTKKFNEIAKQLYGSGKITKEQYEGYTN